MIAFDGEFLCAACDDGTHPPLPEGQKPMVPAIAEALKPAQVSAILDAAISSFHEAHAGQLDYFLPGSTPNPNEGETAMGRIPSNRRRGERVDPEIKALVLAASPKISNCALARKYHITDSCVSYWRRDAGIKSLAKGGLRVTCAPVEKNVAPATEIKPPAAVAPASRAPAVESTPGVPVQLMVDEKTLDRWWANLDPTDKAAIFGGNYVIRLEGVVS
ncbi:MAG: hypothetical protein ACLQKY_17975 [Terracidiphilus sp.]